MPGIKAATVGTIPADAALPLLIPKNARPILTLNSNRPNYYLFYA